MGLGAWNRWNFNRMGGSINEALAGLFIIENPIEMDDLGVPPDICIIAGWFIIEHPIRIDDLGAFSGTTILGTLHMWDGDDPQPAR